jgi:hypothetical protein
MADGDRAGHQHLGLCEAGSDSESREGKEIFNQLAEGEQPSHVELGEIGHLTLYVTPPVA